MEFFSIYSLLNNSVCLLRKVCRLSKAVAQNLLIYFIINCFHLESPTLIHKRHPSKNFMQAGYPIPLGWVPDLVAQPQSDQGPHLHLTSGCSA